MTDRLESESLKRWTIEETFKLINLYKEHSILWNFKHPEYKNKDERQLALISISQELGANTEEIKRKLKNMTTQYVREKRKFDKISDKMKAGDFRSRWFGFKAMSFLGDKSQFRGGVPQKYVYRKYKPDQGDSCVIEDGTVDMSEDIESAEHNYCEDSAEAGKKQNKSVMQRIIAFPIKMENSKSSMGATATNRTMNTSANANLLFKGRPMLKSINLPTNPASKGKLLTSVAGNKDKPRDEYDIFGELVAHKIRNLKTHFAKSTVQHLFNNILYNAELGQYNNPVPQAPIKITYKPMDTTPPVVISNESENDKQNNQNTEPAVKSDDKK